MRDYLRQDNLTWYGMLLLSVAFAVFGWGKDDQVMASRTVTSWQETQPSALQPVAFEKDVLKDPVTFVVPTSNQLLRVVMPDDLAHSGYCNGHCESGDPIFQMAQQDPINRLSSESVGVQKIQLQARFARIQFYMHERYDLPWGSGQRDAMCRWASASPVDGWELARNRQVVAMGGVANPFVDMPGQLALRCAGKEG